MKKMIHIAAAPGLAVLLSACAGPGPVGLENAVQEALTNPGPGGLNPVQEALANPGPGGLNPVQQAMVDALKPSSGSNQNAAVQQAVNAAVQQALAQGKEGEEVLYRELTYTFSNLDAFDLTKSNRMVFVDTLHGDFDSYGRKQGYELISTYRHRRKMPPPHDILSEWGGEIDRGEGWELEGLRFELSDVEKGIEVDARKEIEKFIKAASDGNDTGLIKGTPVVGKDDPPKPVTFKTLAVNYSSASGRAGFKIGDGSKWEPPNCPELKIELSTKGTVKQHRAAKAYISLPDYDDVEEWTGKVPLTFTAEWKPKKGGGIGEGECKFGDVPRTAYAMVLLREEELSVAEYHKIDVSLNPDTLIPNPLSVDTVEGRFTKRIPACPPLEEEGWGDKVRRAFIDKLYAPEIRVGCTNQSEEPFEPVRPLLR